MSSHQSAPPITATGLVRGLRSDSVLLLFFRLLRFSSLRKNQCRRAYKIPSFCLGKLVNHPSVKIKINIKKEGNLEKLESSGLCKTSQSCRTPCENPTNCTRCECLYAHVTRATISQSYSKKGLLIYPFQLLPIRYLPFTFAYNRRLCDRRFQFFLPLCPCSLYNLTIVQHAQLPNHVKNHPM